MKLSSITIKKPYHLLMLGLFYILTPLFSNAQEGFDIEVLEKELIFQLNQYRESQSLPILQRAEKLDAIAFDQAEYVASKGRVLHEQEKEQKKTLLDRILYFEAFNAEAGENIAMIAPNSKVAIAKGGEKLQLASPELLVQAALFSWQEDEDSRLNLDDPNFYEVGIGIHESEKKEFVLVVVIASMPYELPEKVKQKFNLRGVKPYNKESCKDFDEKFGTVPELFSDAFIVEDNKLFFQYHNQALVEKVLENSEDAISAEIIVEKQFDCGGSNRLFPGEVTDGYLLPLLRKGSIANLNTATNKGEVKLFVGEIPEAFLSENYEVNGMIIKNNVKCASIPFNKIEVENLRWLNLPFQLVRSGGDSITEWKDSLTFEFHARNLQELDQELNRYKLMVSQLGLTIQKVTFAKQISPTEDSSFFDGFEEKVMQFFSLDSSVVSVPVSPIEINWKAFDDFQTNTVYQIDTKGMDRPALRNYLKETAVSDLELANFLKSITLMKMHFEAKIHLGSETEKNNVVELFHFARGQEMGDLALYFFNQMIADESINVEQLLGEKERMEQNKNDLPLINNLIVAAANKGAVVFDGNAITTAFMELHLIDASVPMIRYNYLVSQIHDWAIRRTKVNNPKGWLDSFNKLKSWVDQDLFARVVLNYHMILADYFYEQHDAKEREDAFEEVMRWLPKSKLSEEELYAMAQYLTFQDQSSRAIKSLLPIVKEEKSPSKHLFYFLQLAMYDSDLVPWNLYWISMQKAATLYPSDFCKLFSKDKMGVQSLKQYELKALYCERCK